jgi:hypothetical protein
MTDGVNELFAVGFRDPVKPIPLVFSHSAQTYTHSEKNNVNIPLQKGHG